MKHFTQKCLGACLFLSAAMLGMNGLADTSATDTPLAIQRDRVLVQPYQRVNVLGKGWKKTGRSSHRAQSMAGAGATTGYATASVVMQGTIHLPGSSQNNTRLRNAISGVHDELVSMKTAASPEAYDQYQNVALTGLDVAVSTYMDSRRAYPVPVTQAESNNDVFLQTMASLKMDVMRKSLSAEELDDMLNRLAVAREQLVDLSEALQ